MSKPGSTSRSWQPGQAEPDWGTWTTAELVAVARTLLEPDALARLEELEEMATAERRQRKSSGKAAKLRQRDAQRRAELLEHLKKAAGLSGRLGPLWGLCSRLLLAALEAARRVAKREGLPEGAERPQRASQGTLWGEARETA